MTELNKRDRELVAIGASIASNCVPCIAYHIGQAKAAGFANEEIQAAIALATEIRSVPATLVLNTAQAYLDERGEADSSPEEPCPPKCCC